MSTVDVVTVENRKLFAVEVAIILLLFLADRYGYVPFSTTLWLFALGWISLRMRGFRWRDVGFEAPESWAKAIGLGLAAGAAMGMSGLYLIRPLLARMTGQEPGVIDVLVAPGDTSSFALTLVLVWLSAFGGELAYRGYLMTRFGRMLGGTGAAWIVSLVVVSMLFGFGHVNQGVIGVIENVIYGLLLGALYIATGRNLVAPILAHGVANTIDLTLIYLGQYPGV